MSNIARSSFPYGTLGLITTEPSSAVGDPTAQPITGSPDLAVLSLATHPNPTGGVLVQAVVRNQGDAPAQNGFLTDLHANHLPVGPDEFTGSIRYWVADPIEPGQRVVLTTRLDALPAASGAPLMALAASAETSSTLYVQTDSTGAVAEPDDQNNISEGYVVCAAGPDDYESDDSTELATVLVPGVRQVHSFHMAGDEDWFRFTAEAGRAYTVTTSQLGEAADTYLYVHGSDGSTVLAANNDYGNSRASRMDWTASVSGIYYVLVKHWNPNAGGRGSSCVVALVEQQTPTPEPTIMPAPSPTPMPTPTPCRTPSERAYLPYGVALAGLVIHA